MNCHRLAISFLLVAAACVADTRYPLTDADAPNPVASLDAYEGGLARIYGAQSPKSLNNYLDTNYMTVQVFGLLYDSLLSVHPITYEYTPGIAKAWTISDDKKTFTFEIDPRAKWSDGRSITAADVAWTVQAILDPKHLTGPFKVDFERFETPEVLDEHRVRFTAKEVHWKNLGAFTSLIVLPKHIFATLDFNRVNFEFPVVSGPYRLGSIKEGIKVDLERRDDWWARARKSTVGTYNIGTMSFRFFAERENAYAAFRKGDIDVFPVYTSHRWVNQTGGEKFDKNWIVKQKILNSNPVGFQGFAMNMRRAPYDDIRVRKALAHLLDRGRMNERLMYNQYFLHRSYWEDLYDEKNPCPNELIGFDKEAARKLLSEAGWRANPDTGWLEKGGKPFRITFLTRDSSSQKFLDIFKEDLKDVGIDLIVDQKDTAAWTKDMDAFNYEMTWSAWGASVRKDPEPAWHSREAERSAGPNITGFKSDKVDALIEQQSQNYDIAQRHEFVRQMDAIIYAEIPYVLLWNINYTRLLYWNKFGTPETVLDKYGDEIAVLQYFWVDEDSEADLEDAIENGDALPRKPFERKFSELFKKQ
jgi:microcin C transport system substrate-binding protein